MRTSALTAIPAAVMIVVVLVVGSGCGLQKKTLELHPTADRPNQSSRFDESPRSIDEHVVVVRDNAINDDPVVELSKFSASVTMAYKIE
jgi:hypothetical protein